MKRISDYEKRLLEDRVKLDELLDENYMDCSDVVKNKLKFFSQEMEYLEKQLNCIKKSESISYVGEYSIDSNKNVEKNIEINNNVDKNIEINNNVDKNIETNNNVNKVPDNNIISTNIVSVNNNSNENNIIQNNKRVKNAIVTQSETMTDKASPTKTVKDLEQMVGKSLMGVFASILIFIGLIITATLIIPKFNDTAKMCLTYLISFAFLGAGLYLTRKDENNKFYLALTGCGVGALFISLILSNVYFDVFSDLVLYVFIAIWAIGVCALSKIKNQVFEIVGLCGITIAIMFGGITCVINNDDTKFIALILFYIIASTTFYATHFSKSFVNNLANNAFNAIIFAYLFSTCESITGEYMILSKVIIAIMILDHIVIALYCTIDAAKYSIGIYISAMVLIYLMFISSMIDNDILFGCIAWNICAVVIGVIEKKAREYNIGPNIANGFLAVLTMYIWFVGTDELGHLAALLIIIPLVVLGYYRKNNVYKYISMIMLFIYTFNFDIEYWERLVFGVITLGITYGLMYVKKDQYTMIFKYVCYIVGMIFLFTIPNFMIEELIRCIDELDGLNGMVTLVLTSAFNLFILKGPFGDNLENGETENKVLYKLVNTILMLMGLSCISSQYNIFIHFVLICVTLVLFMVNVKNFLDKQDNLLGGIYVGFKFTLFMVVVLSSFESPSYFISIGCFIASIISIIIGFKKRYKALRVYGLVLSMVSIVKLIMIDIFYDNNIGHAISFIASGLLCFSISMIYNYIDKKIGKGE